jgi:hypothetical protein
MVNRLSGYQEVDIRISEHQVEEFLFSCVVLMSCCPGILHPDYLVF